MVLNTGLIISLPNWISLAVTPRLQHGELMVEVCQPQGASTPGAADADADAGAGAGAGACVGLAICLPAAQRVEPRDEFG